MSSLNRNSRIAVCSRSFSNHAKLREALLERFPNSKFNETGESFNSSTIVAFLEGCDGAIIGLETVTGETLSKLPDLKVIGKYGVGIDKLDLDAFKKHNVALGWTPGVNRRAVSELTLAFFIMMLRRIPYAAKVAKEGPWHQVQGRSLTGMTVGIIGMGHIGQDLTVLLKPFQCRILGNDIADRTSFASANGVEMTALDRLLRESDLVTVHVPLNPETRNLISKDQLSLMKKSAYLVNAARGGIVSESDLLSALNAGVIAGAAFDVMEVEPPESPELLAHEKFFLTPHIGGSTLEAVYAMGLAAIDGLQSAGVPE